MVDITCDNCGSACDDGEHWIHVSVFHHDDGSNPNKWDKDNPRNFVASLCPECAEAVIEGAGGEKND